MVCSAEGKYPNVCMFGCWPPHFVAQNSIQDYQLRSLLPEGYKHENMDAPPPTVPSAGSPVVTPHSTRENTPAAGHDDTTHVDASEATGAETVPDTKSQTSSSDSKSTPKPEESAEKDPKLSSGSTQGPSEKPETEQASEKKANVVTSTQHAAPESGASISGDAKPAKPDDASLSPPSGGIGLALPTRTVAPNRTDSSLNLEAYILRPLCEDIHQAIKLTYKIEQLRLDDEEIQAHMRKLGLDHSVLDTLGELHSEQLRLIQIHAKDRHGYIMAVQHGRPVDLVTKMGTFQVKPVIFVLKAARPPENESGPETTNTQANAVHPPLFGNPLPAPSAFCGFGSGPLSMNNNTSLTAEDYRQQLEFRGEPCTHIEPDGRVPQGLQHFQSIKPYFRKDISFEEVRKADMEAGRTGLTNSNGFAGYPWDKSTPSTLGGGGLFGTKPSATTEGGYKEYVDLSRNKQLTGGLFGTPSSSRDPLNLFGQRPGGGLFGNSSSSAGFGQSNTSGGLFGGLTQRVNPGGGLFGSSSNTGGGLFGNLGQHTSTAGTSLSGVAPASSSGGGLFGSSNAQNNRPTSGLFGDPQPAPSSGPFGRAPSAPSTGLFGSAPAASPAPSTGLFGNTQTAQTSGLFGNAHSAPSSGLFGSTQAAPSGPHITGAFGSTPPAHPSGLSGTAPAPYVRGSARGGLFAGLCPTDNTPSPGLFGSARPNDQPKPSLFGNPSSQPKVTPGGLFPSSAPQGRASPFGAPSTSLSATDLFGKPVTHSSNAPSNVGYCGLSNSAPRTNAFDSSSASGFGTQSSSASNPNPFAPTPSSLGTGLFNIAPPPSTNPSFANSFAAPPPTAPGPNPFTAAPKPSTTPSQASGTTAPEPTTTGDNASSTLANRKTCTVCCTHLIFHTAAEQASKICDNCADKASTTPCIYCQFANLSTIGPATEVPTDQVTNHYAKNGKHVVCDTCRKDICLHREAEQQARRCDACARVEETECDHCKLAILNKTIGKGARKVPASSSFATSGTPAKTTDEDAGAAAELKSGAEASKEDHAKEETREAGEAKSVEAGNKHARVEDEDDEDSVDV
ncbi:hypothetical protein BU26DRAFT_29526 [Trematosphaeria pertusa]|uniref:Uncharacterized protein n=1 Tax=Trematosphaeria pertusa TaxID=390896 RepID=A0A6A6J2A4_9PLEO|nr:uncharacterized protein BU26DRAFT_29526 [Trematosphaeria pertusa]KAF2256796.1 hypothetical protein BU26DRAFT_29526 [Trematosphaeria pertusa]